MHIRKQMKADAKKVLKRHYFLFVLLCLTATLLSGELIMAGTSGEASADDMTPQTRVTFTNAIVTSFTEFVVDVAEGRKEDREQRIREKEERYVEESRGEEIFGRSRGVLASVVNKLTSGACLMTLLVGIRSLVGTDEAAVVVLLLGALALLGLFQIFVVGVCRTVVIRMFLEGRCYEKVPGQRIWYLLRVKKWCHVAAANFVTGFFLFLWSLTVIGGLVKSYSYHLVPYLLAENPSMKTLEAITLSRKLMNGHKWECFVLELSFFGWDLLGIFTLGISDILFTMPYKMAVMGEYYARLRSLGIGDHVEGVDLLNDVYLFRRADRELLRQEYADADREYDARSGALPRLKGINRFLAENFGVTMGQSREVRALEEEQSRRFLLDYDRKALEGRIYPTRLHPVPEKRKRKWVVSLNYLRCYSLWSVVLMFFALSFVGWLWEVGLHLIADGEFVNRGVLHGPWLPIYGTGSVMMLLLLNRFRRKPVLEFVLAVLLCGCVEYFTSVYLEYVHDGTRWWDYTGYFLNLHGRICAEGLLVFGIGGMAIVYVLAPFLDGLFRKVPPKLLIAAGVVALAVFAADQVYSWGHPNEGKGITDYQTRAEAAAREVEKG
ncbi:MAG: DUF975 family protein [Lachnospiraceae bacterium]|nr:DUF975 family protein [Lachnospiraceae bacterium]